MRFTDYLTKSSNITPEMVLFFKKRLTLHRKLVSKFANLLMKEFPKLNNQKFKHNIEMHDLDKLQPQEYGFVLYHWYKYKLKDTSNIPEEYKEAIKQAFNQHGNNSNHHIEGWNSSMSYDDIAEMCCDWAAVSIENGVSILQSSMALIKTTGVSLNIEQEKMIVQMLKYLES